LVERLRRDDVVTLSLPGFGCAVPAGFDCSKEAYADWLRAELRRIERPIDLVGHDWGALLVLRAVSLEPGLARTWAAGAAPLDAEYEWHRAAKLWQTPAVGEQVMEQLTPEVLASALVAAGVPPSDAAGAAEHVDPTMKRSILALYRSAVRVGSEWQGDLGRIPARGLVLWGERDPYAAPMYGSRLASRTGARFVAFPGCSHWWQLERAGDVAKELEAHWS
ncbi:MAG: alpha/beta fold hydrolase, partial [Candidatus Rokuibacteriota bacterium]